MDSDDISDLHEGDSDDGAEVLHGDVILAELGRCLLEQSKAQSSFCDAKLRFCPNVHETCYVYTTMTSNDGENGKRTTTSVHPQTGNVALSIDGSGSQREMDLMDAGYSGDTCDAAALCDLSNRVARVMNQRQEHLESLDLLPCRERHTTDRHELEGSMSLLHDEHRLVHAHKCVLQATTRYFTKMFSCVHLGESRVKDVYDIPCHSHDVLRAVIDYLYTGVITATLSNVEHIMHLAEYLGIDSLKALCAAYLMRKLDMNTIAMVASLADLYCMPSVTTFVQAYVQPLIIKFYSSPKLVHMPATLLEFVLANTEMKYLPEIMLFSVLAAWWTNDPVKRAPQMSTLMRLISTEYLPESLILALIDSNFFKLLQIDAPLIVTDPPFQDVLIARTYSRRKCDTVRLLLFHVNQQEWLKVKPIAIRDTHFLNGSETMVCLDSKIYVLVEEMEYTGYITYANSNKRFVVCDLRTGEWRELSSLKNGYYSGFCRLVVANSSTILCIDQGGVVNSYRVQVDHWYRLTEHHQYAAHHTKYMVPFVANEYLYLLRAHTPTDTAHSSATVFSFYVLRMDLDEGWRSLSADCECGELGITDDVHLIGYAYTPEQVTFTDTFGNDRTSFDFSTRLWSPVKQTKVEELAQCSWLGQSYGYIQINTRVYVVSKLTQGEEDGTRLVMYDVITRKVKQVASPGDRLSGVMVSARVTTQQLRNATCAIAAR